MSEQIPSAMLLAAADRIRDLAAAATPGPWQWRDPGGHVKYALMAGDKTVVTSGIPDVYPSAADARWIAALSPATAEPLIEWLRASAGSVAAMEEMGRGRLLTESEVAAVRFAAVVVPDLVGDTP